MSLLVTLLAGGGAALIGAAAFVYSKPSARARQSPQRSTHPVSSVEVLALDKLCRLAETKYRAATNDSAPEKLVQLANGFWAEYLAEKRHPRAFEPAATYFILGSFCVRFAVEFGLDVGELGEIAYDLSTVLAGAFKGPEFHVTEQERFKAAFRLIAERTPDAIEAQEFFGHLVVMLVAGGPAGLAKYDRDSIHQAFDTLIDYAVAHLS